MFLKKFENLKLEPTCTSRGFTILYTRRLTTIKTRKAVRRDKKKRTSYRKTNVKQTLNFRTNSHPSNKKEMGERKKKLWV